MRIRLCLRGVEGQIREVSTEAAAVLVRAGYASLVEEPEQVRESEGPVETAEAVAPAERAVSVRWR